MISKIFRILFYFLFLANLLLAEDCDDPSYPLGYSINPLVGPCTYQACLDGFCAESNCGVEEYCIPTDFIYNSSTVFSFYFFNNVVIDGISIDDEDWVGSFIGNTCIGARKWGSCNGALCEVPVMGDNFSQFDTLNDGYIVAGEIPSFKIFKSSNLTYYNADIFCTENCSTLEWQNQTTPINDVLYTCIESDCNIIDCNGIPAGFSIEDDCGICDGPGSIYDCGCFSSDCSNSCELNSYEDLCGLCDDDVNNDCIPNWDCNIDGELDNLYDYQSSGSITSIILNDFDENIIEEGDMLAAFIDDEQRGIAIPLYIPFGQWGGGYAFLSLIYGNPSEDNFKEISFKFYDSSLNIVYEINEPYLFEIDMTLGNVSTPELLTLHSLSEDIFISCEDMELSGTHPFDFSLNQNFPNPFNPYTIIHFTLHENNFIDLIIYDLTGKVIKKIFSGYLERGEHKIKWDGTNNRNFRVPSSMYIVELRNKRESQYKKLTLIK